MYCTLGQRLDGNRRTQANREQTHIITETVTESEREEIGRRDRKNRTKRNTRTQPMAQMEAKTYASIAGTTPPRQAGSGWKTPEQAEEKYEATVEVTEVRNVTESK